MAFKLEEDAKKGVIQVRYHGVVDRIDLWNGRLELASMVERTGIKNVVVDMRGAKLNLDSVDEYQFSSSNIKYLPKGTTIATITEKDDPFKFDYKFIETVSLNHGFPTKIFTNVKEAEQWLFISDY